MSVVCDLCASDFPIATFRVLKEKKGRYYGEYGTHRLVLEAWDRLEDIEFSSISCYPIVIDGRQV